MHTASTNTCYVRGTGITAIFRWQKPARRSANFSQNGCERGAPVSAVCAEHAPHLPSRLRPRAATGIQAIAVQEHATRHNGLVQARACIKAGARRRLCSDFAICGQHDQVGVVESDAAQPPAVRECVHGQLDVSIHLIARDTPGVREVSREQW